jgi:hypothetical protein
VDGIFLTSFCLKMPRLVKAMTALPTDSNNEAAALPANSNNKSNAEEVIYDLELEEPTPKKQRIKQHGIKTKNSKKTIVSASRPRNEEEKKKLKKSVNMLGYINLPRGRPTKASTPHSQSSESRLRWIKNRLSMLLCPCHCQQKSAQPTRIGMRECPRWLWTLLCNQCCGMAMLIMR